MKRRKRPAPRARRRSASGSHAGRQTLRSALRFGGSTRFNDRRGLGRYGMGLPNSSLSQARCVRAYTWQSSDDICMSYLDVDEIAAGAIKRVPVPRRAKRPLEGEFDESGTIVVWSRCDQLDNRRVSTITRKLLAALGRRFRYFIWDGVRITINGDLVEPLDPLFIHQEAKYNGAELFGEPIEYEVQADPARNHTWYLILGSRVQKAIRGGDLARRQQPEMAGNGYVRPFPIWQMAFATWVCHEGFVRWVKFPGTGRKVIVEFSSFPSALPRLQTITQWNPF